MCAQGWHGAASDNNGCFAQTAQTQSHRARADRRTTQRHLWPRGVAGGSRRPCICAAARRPADPPRPRGTLVDVPPKRLQAEGDVVHHHARRPRQPLWAVTPQRAGRDSRVRSSGLVRSTSNTAGTWGSTTENSAAVAMMPGWCGGQKGAPRAPDRTDGPQVAAEGRKGRCLWRSQPCCQAELGPCRQRAPPSIAACHCRGGAGPGPASCPSARA